MNFLSVKLQNFGNIRSFEKTFNKGLLILSGDNGNGKSTVLKAILLNVFDSYSGVLADYVNWDSKFFVTEVRFSHKGQDFVSTVRYDGSTERTLEVGKDTYKGDEAKRKLKETLDPDLLKAAMLSLEQEIDIVSAKPSERRDYLKRIYSLDFKAVLEDIASETQEKTLEQAKTTSKIDDLSTKTYTEVEKPVAPFDEKTLNTYKTEKEELAKDVFKMEKAEEEQKQLLSDITKATNEENRLTASLDEETEKEEQQKNKIAGIPDCEKAEKESLLSELESLKKESETSEKEFSDKKEDLEKQLSGLGALKRVGAFDEDSYVSLKADISSKEKTLQDLKSATDVCPTCGQSINSPEHIAKRDKEIKELESALTELRATLEQKTKERNAVNEGLLHNQKIKEQKDSITRQIEAVAISQKERAELYLTKVSSKEKEIAGLEQKFVQEKAHAEEVLLSVENTIKTLKESRQKAQEEKDALIKKMQESEDFSSKLETSKTRLQELETLITSYVQYVSKKEVYENNQKEIEEQKKKDAEELQTLKDSMQKMASFIADAEVETKILKTEFPVYVISRVVKDIEYHMNEFLKKTYAGRYTVEVIDKNGSLRIVYGPKKQDVSLASGYEKSLFNLAFKIAISKAIGNRCLLLDEADAAASTKNSALFYSVLGSSVGTYFDQVILVSHKETVRDMLENEFKAEVVTFINGVAQ